MVTRRSVLGILGASALAGCSQTDTTAGAGPEDTETPTSTSSFEELVNPTENPSSGSTTRIVDVGHTEPRIVSSDHLPDASGTDEFELTLQNTGVEGSIKITMWWVPEGTSPKEDDVPDSRMMLIASGFREHQQKTLFFNSDERRAIEITGEPPSDANGYYFTVDSATRIVRLKNDGAAEEVTVVLKSQSEDEQAIDEKTVFVGKGQEKVVEFSDDYPNIGEKWEFELVESTDSSE